MVEVRISGGLADLAGEEATEARTAGVDGIAGLRVALFTEAKDGLHAGV